MSSVASSAKPFATAATIAAAVALAATPAWPATADEPSVEPANEPARTPDDASADPPADQPYGEGTVRDLGRILNGPEVGSLPGEVAHMERLLRDIAGRPGAGSAASRALGRARAALKRATLDRQSDRTAAAERAEAIARAALVLAARLVTREQAHQILRSAERRAERAESDATAARVAQRKALEQKDAARRALRRDASEPEPSEP